MRCSCFYPKPNAKVPGVVRRASANAKAVRRYGNVLGWESSMHNFDRGSKSLEAVNAEPHSGIKIVFERVS